MAYEPTQHSSFEEKEAWAKHIRHEEYKLKQLLASNPTDATLYKELADLYLLALGNVSAAKHNYNLALKFNPNNIAAIRNIGLLFLEHEGDYSKARNYFEQALDIEPNDAELHFIVANLLNDHFQEPDKARCHYERAIDINPNYVEAHNNYATLLKNHFKDYEKSKQHLQQALNISPEHTNSIYNLAVLLQMHLADYSEARRLYNQLLEINPTDAWVHNNLALLSLQEFGPSENFISLAKKTEKFPLFDAPQINSANLNPTQVGAFNSLFSQKYGLYADLDTIKKGQSAKNFQWILNHLKSEVKTSKIKIKDSPIIHIGFMFDTNLRAAAGKVNNEYYIGISTASFIILFYLYNALLANKGVLPDYGNPDRETEAPKFYSTRLLDVDTLLLNTDPDDKIIPNDERRQSLALLMVGFALGFLVAHECTHILHGHLDYYIDKNSSQTLSWEETIAKLVPPNSPLDGMTLQTLEYDADLGAMQQSMERLLNAYERNTITPRQDRFSPFFQELDKSIYLLCFAITSLFRLYGNKNTDYTKLLSYDHPPAVIRLRIVRMLLSTLFFDERIQSPKVKSLFTEELKSKLSKTLSHVLVDVHDAFDVISESDSKAEGSQALQFSFDHREHVYKLMVRWNEIRSDLLNFSYTQALGKSDLSESLDEFLKHIFI